MPCSILSFYEAWKLGVGSKKGRIMWKLSFFAVIWAVWKEGNRRCFEGKMSSHISVLEKVKVMVVSWVSILPQFKGVSFDCIMSN